MIIRIGDRVNGSEKISEEETDEKVKQRKGKYSLKKKIRDEKLEKKLKILEMIKVSEIS